jgi:ferric enterobactin receptor
MKKFLFLLVLTTGSSVAFAQAPSKGNGKISGVVKDSTNNALPVEYANVTLIDQSTDKPVDGAMCDDKGKFSISKIAPGTYTVSVSFLGYDTKNVKNITVTDAKSDFDLGTVAIGQTAKVLKEVVVEGQKALVEEKVDRTVYNAENDQTTKGGDATDVLKRVPMLSVDMDGNVSLRGSQNIKVLINNKPSTITASSVADALKQIPADQIKTVEVITSPSAKYDAEGSAGIINIITKKNNMQGFSLNVDGSAGYRGSNLGLNGSYRKGKMGFSLGGFGRSGYNVHGTFQNNQTTNFTDPSDNSLISLLNIQQANTHRNDIGGNYTLGWDYDINKNNSLTASVRYGARNNYSYQDNLLTQTFQNDALLSMNTKNVKTTDLSGTVDMNLNYTHTFAKPQREFSLLALYSRNNRTNNFVSGTLSAQQIDSIRNKNVNTSINRESAIQVDYQTPIGSTQLLEVGGKNIMRAVTSDYKYFIATGTEGDYSPSNNPQQVANVFNYNQNITSGYLSYTLSLPSGYAIKAGSRYEYTTINAHFQNPSATSEESTNIPSYGVLVPSANISRKLKNGNVLKAAYNRRIQRPSIQFLNPNLQYSNSLSVTRGNTGLSPEYTNNYELAYSTYVGGSSLNFSGFMRNTNNSIQSIRKPFHPASDTVLTTYANIGKEDAYGMSVFAGINVSNKFTLNGGTDVYYAVLNNNNPDPQYNSHNEGWVYNIRMFGNYKVADTWGLQFFGFYRGRQVLLQGFQGGFGVYSISVKKDLLNKKGSLGLGAENMFTPSIRIHNSVSSPLIDSRSVNVIHNTNFKITFSYRIGKMSFDSPRKRKKSISDDDLKEAADNNPSNQQQQQQGGTTGGQGGGAPAVTTGQGAGGKGPGQGAGGRGTYNGGNGNGAQKYQGGGQRQGGYPKKDSLKQDSLKRDFPPKPLKLDSTKSDTTKRDSTKRVLPQGTLRKND